jgi:hypothetical protein
VAVGWVKMLNNYQVGAIKVQTSIFIQNSSIFIHNVEQPSHQDRRHSNINTTTKFNSTIIIGCKLQSNYTSMTMEQGS